MNLTGEIQDKQNTIVQLFAIRSLKRRNQKYREWLIFEKENHDTIKETVLIADADYSYSPVIAQGHFVIGWECHEFFYRIPKDMSCSKSNVFIVTVQLSSCHYDGSKNDFSTVIWNLNKIWTWFIYLFDTFKYDLYE